MPYVDNRTRAELEKRTPQTPGELNYAITQLLIAYTKSQGLSYQTINDINGAVEGAKLEYYFRVARKYEDRKIRENGDVYPQYLVGDIA